MSPDSSYLFHIKTFGCQMNVYDSMRIASLLKEQLGIKEVEDPTQAQLIIFNTCHIREKAEEKLFSELGRLHKLNRQKNAIFAVGGCVGQAEGEKIFKRAPYVRLVFGPQNYHRLPEWWRRLQHGEERILDEESPQDAKFDELPPVVTLAAAAAVTVQEGCDRFCSYCVVPYTRGREWSRPVHDVVQEVAGLVQQGVVEIQLLGQNVNAYRGIDETGVVHDLALLIRRIGLLPGVKRIRFATSHPADMSDDLLEVFAEVAELCPYLHLPIQSGSNRILQAMQRHHSQEEYCSWINRLRAKVPHIVISSDFIVGFPGESEQEFAETMQLVEKIGFDQAYSFKFSPRPGTQAALLPNQVDEEVKTNRLWRLQALLNAQQTTSNQRQVGRIETVLVEGWSKQNEGELTGRTPGMRKVNFPGPAAFIGQLVPVTITAGLPNSLRGVL